MKTRSAVRCPTHGSLQWFYLSRPFQRYLQRYCFRKITCSYYEDKNRRLKYSSREDFVRLLGMLVICYWKRIAIVFIFVLGIVGPTDGICFIRSVFHHQGGARLRLQPSLESNIKFIILLISQHIVLGSALVLFSMSPALAYVCLGLLAQAITPTSCHCFLVLHRHISVLTITNWGWWLCGHSLWGQCFHCGCGRCVQEPCFASLMLTNTQ